MTERAKAWNAPQSPAARREIETLIASLQTAQSAEDFNRHFADDIVWGNPSGGVVNGFETLHSIHRRFFKSPLLGAGSRFTLANLVFHGDTIAVAHVRREAVDAQGQVIETDSQANPYIFHEMAMYVLAHRDGAWWIAAGQNTPLRPNPIQLASDSES